MASPPPRPRYRFRLTRLGFHFLFVALFAIIGGSLRGFNLLLVLAGLLISAVIVQWRQGRGMIRRVRMTRQSLAGVFAGESFQIQYEVHNASRLIPLWGIRIEDQIRRVSVGGDGAQRSQEPDDDALLDASIGGVMPQRSSRGSIRCRIQQRGKYALGPAIASTTYPFSMMKCDRMSPGSIEPIFVFPRLLNLRRDWQTLLPARRGGDGRRAAGRTDAEGEFFGLRAWQSGDQLKNVHWRTTAKLGYPAVRQFEYRARHQFHLLVDATDDSLEVSADFELLLSFAATLLNELSNQSRFTRLAVIDGHREETRWRVADGHEPRRLFERLAESSPGDRSGLPNVIEALSTPDAGEMRNSDLVVLSGNSFDAAVAEQDSVASRKLRDLIYTKRFAWLDIRSSRVRRFLLGYRSTPTWHAQQSEADAART
ncbi:MAG: DUF58 domain-containing protein [Planctomycetota bacterium]